MRISFLLSSLQLSGGVLLVMEYARRLAARGHAVSLVTPAGTVEAELCARLPATVQVVESRVALGSRQKPWQLAALAGSLAQAAPAGDVLVATHTPTVVPTLLASWLLRKGRAVWLYMDYPEMFRHRPVERFLLAQTPRFFEAIATISRPLAEAVAPATKGRVFVSGCGLPRAEQFQPLALPRQPSDEVRLFYVGDNRPRKGFQDLQAALAIVYRQHPNLKLVIASKVAFPVETPAPYEFHLHPENGALAKLYRTADLFVSTSWGEGLGYPPLEAMASGVPVVLTDSVGVRDYAVDGENCLLVPARDPQRLAGAILRLLADPALAAGLVRQGLLTTGRYRWEDAVERFEAELAAL